MVKTTRTDFEGSGNIENTKDTGSEGPPIKVRRINRACIQCRVRKQRCDGQSAEDPTARISCNRCTHSGVTCSFTTTPPDVNNYDDAQATKVAKTAHGLEKLQKCVAEQNDRILRLEKLTVHLDKVAATAKERLSRAYDGRDGVETSRRHSNYDRPKQGPKSDAKSLSSPASQSVDSNAGHDVAYSSSTASSQTRTTHTPHAALDAVHLDTPMSTLRRLQHYPGYDVNQNMIEEDPVSSGLITMAEAQEAFNLYFSSCHKWAPVLCPRRQSSAAIVRSSCSTLFTSICAVAFRFMTTSSPSSSSRALRYQEILNILDSFLSRLVLKPHSSDVHLGHVQALLLYVQWMPVDVQTKNSHQRDDRPGTRYNDVSAWSMLGLAIRYALFLGLQDSPSAFLPERQASATIEDLARLRVWINLLTCDANLMLSSGLPASLNPEPVALVSQAFASHRDASQPDDTRVAALCELVAILKHAARSSGSPNVRALDAFSLRRANLEFDAWESHWNQALGPELMHNQLPYTALRAYRLTVNSSCLSTLLARPVSETSSSLLGQLPLHSIEALNVSLIAACQTILALSQQATWETWHTDYILPAIPAGPLTINHTAVDRITFSVDSSWVSHSFAAVFLVLCFARGAIDDDLNILALANPSTSLSSSSSSPSAAATARYPARPRTQSLLSRLINLAAEIFDIICSKYPLAHHPAAGYQDLLTAVFAPLLNGDVYGRNDNDNDNDNDIQDVMGLQTDGLETYLDNFFESMVSTNSGFGLRAGRSAN